MSEYTEQAEKFLADTGTTFSIEYLYAGHYFHDDKEKRDIYQFTLKNAKGEYSSKFGDSIHNTERRKFATDTWNQFRPDPKQAQKLGFKLTGSKANPEVSKTEMIAARKHKPSAYDILACLQKYDVGSFDDFCADFGYNDNKLSDYPKVMQIYHNCCNEYNALRRMFTADQLDQLYGIN